MSDVQYPSKKRIEVDGVLVHAEGDDLAIYPDEAKRQGYNVDDSEPRIALKRIERDGVLIAAEGDVLHVDEPDVKPAADKATASKAKK